MRHRCRLCLAWVVLHVMEAVLATRGFHAAHRLATSTPPWRRPSMTPADADAVARVARVLAAARRWHGRLSPDGCLPVALAGVFLLRSERQDAHLVLGVQVCPFGAHAWVRVGEHVLDFPPNRFKRFIAIDMA